MTRVLWGWMLAGCAAAVLVVSPGAAQHTPAPRARVALTFDDLPSHGALPAGVTCPVQVNRHGAE